MAPRTHRPPLPPNHHTHTQHMINHGEKVPSKSTWVPLTSGPHFSGQLRMAAPPASSPCLLASLCQGAQMFLLLVLSCLWPSMDGSIGKDYMEADAWFSGSSPVSLSAGPCPKVLTLACRWTAPAWNRVCVGVCASVWPSAASAGERQRGRGSVVQWVAAWGLELDHLGSGPQPRQHQGLPHASVPHL